MAGEHFRVQWMRANDAAHNTTNGGWKDGLDGEITVNTTKKVVVVHDGDSNTLGHEMMRADFHNAAVANLATLNAIGAGTNQVNNADFILVADESDSNVFKKITVQSLLDGTDSSSSLTGVIGGAGISVSTTANGGTATTPAVSLTAFATPPTGTYGDEQGKIPQITVDQYGRISAASEHALVAGDIPELSTAKISDITLPGSNVSGKKFAIVADGTKALTTGTIDLADVSGLPSATVDADRGKILARTNNANGYSLINAPVTGFQATDGTETAVADDDLVPFFDASDSNSRTNATKTDFLGALHLRHLRGLDIVEYTASTLAERTSTVRDTASDALPLINSGIPVSAIISNAPVKFYLVNDANDPTPDTAQISKTGSEVIGLTQLSVGDDPDNDVLPANSSFSGADVVIGRNRNNILFAVSDINILSGSYYLRMVVGWPESTTQKNVAIQAEPASFTDLTATGNTVLGSESSDTQTSQGTWTHTGDFTLSGNTSNLSVGGNLTVSGTMTTINSTVVDYADSILVLNAGKTGAPSANDRAGLEFERGSGNNVQFRWNEDTDKLEVGKITYADSGIRQGNVSDVADSFSDIILASDVTETATASRIVKRNASGAMLGDLTGNLTGAIVKVHSGHTGAPVANMGIEFERGTGDNPIIRWNEADDKEYFEIGKVSAADSSADVANSFGQIMTSKEVQTFARDETTAVPEAKLAPAMRAVSTYRDRVSSTVIDDDTYHATGINIGTYSDDTLIALYAVSSQTGYELGLPYAVYKKSGLDSLTTQSAGDSSTRAGAKWITTLSSTDEILVGKGADADDDFWLVAKIHDASQAVTEYMPYGHDNVKLDGDFLDKVQGDTAGYSAFLALFDENLDTTYEIADATTRNGIEVFLPPASEQNKGRRVSIKKTGSSMTYGYIYEDIPFNRGIPDYRYTGDDPIDNQNPFFTRLTKWDLVEFESNGSEWRIVNDYEDEFRIARLKNALSTTTIENHVITGSPGRAGSGRYIATGIMLKKRGSISFWPATTISGSPSATIDIATEIPVSSVGSARIRHLVNGLATNYVNDFERNDSGTLYSKVWLAQTPEGELLMEFEDSRVDNTADDYHISLEIYDGPVGFSDILQITGGSTGAAMFPAGNTAQRPASAVRVDGSADITSATTTAGTLTDTGADIGSNSGTTPLEFYKVADPDSLIGAEETALLTGAADLTIAGGWDELKAKTAVTTSTAMTSANLFSNSGLYVGRDTSNNILAGIVASTSETAQIVVVDRKEARHGMARYNSEINRFEGFTKAGGNSLLGEWRVLELPQDFGSGLPTNP